MNTKQAEFSPAGGSWKCLDDPDLMYVADNMGTAQAVILKAYRFLSLKYYCVIL